MSLMQHRPNNVWLRRLLTVGAAISLMTTTTWAAAIEFSKPVVPIAMPEKEQTDLPKPRSKGVDLSAPQQDVNVNVPIAPRPQTLRSPRRERENEDGDGGRPHTWLDDPDDFPDAVGRDNARNGKSSSFSNKKSSRSSSGTNQKSSGANQKNGNDREEQGALSPITDPNWDPRDSDRDGRRKDPLLPSRLGKSERTDSDRGDRENSREKSPYESQEQNEPGQAEQADAFNSRSSFDSLSSRTKMAPTPAQLERRAAFDELLNSGGNSFRAAGSLDPVTALEPPKPAAAIAMPMLGSPAPAPSPFAPPEAFNARPDRVRAPMAVPDFGKKFSEPVKPAAAPAPTESPFQNPLMRQPTVHEIPARRF